MDPALAATQRRAVIATLKTVVTFAVTPAKAVDCLRTMLDAASVAAAGGKLTGYKFSLYSVVDDWIGSTIPTDGTTATIGSDTYRVLNVSAGSVGLRFDMGAQYQQ